MIHLTVVSFSFENLYVEFHISSDDEARVNEIPLSFNESFVCDAIAEQDPPPGLRQNVTRCCFPIVSSIISPSS